MIPIDTKILRSGAAIRSAVLIFSFILASPIYVHAQTLSDVDLIRVCKATVAKTAYLDVKIMRSEGIKENIAYISYNRPSDNKIWKVRCKVDGEKIIWSTVDVDGPGSGFGRWRVHPLDERLTFKLAGKDILIREIYSDGSESSKNFILD